MAVQNSLRLENAWIIIDLGRFLPFNLFPPIFPRSRPREVWELSFFLNPVREVLNVFSALVFGKKYGSYILNLLLHKRLKSSTNTQVCFSSVLIT